MELHVVLASGSLYRKILLERLKIPFEVCVPHIDESPYEGELPEHLARRLGEEKCLAVAQRYPESWVIGSDQVAYAEGQIFGKPYTHDKALEQLRFLQGKTLTLFTSLAVWLPHKQSVQTIVDCTELRYATLPDRVLEAYLKQDQPYDCAASSKIESMGVVLLEQLTTSDPDAIMGLPLIALNCLFRAEGMPIFLSE
jgi:septum formation protein